MYKIVKNHIKSARESQGLTQKELAQLIGVTPVYLNRLEHNLQVPSLTVAYALSRYLCCSIDSLFVIKEL